MDRTKVCTLDHSFVLPVVQACTHPVFSAYLEHPVFHPRVELGLHFIDQPFILEVIPFKAKHGGSMGFRKRNPTARVGRENEELLVPEEIRASFSFSLLPRPVPNKNKLSQPDSREAHFYNFR